jgi:GTP-binding protein Era
MSFHCGYAALVGRPNAGKSTLLNKVLGSKLAITSAKPQTTRNRIAGVHTDARLQVILVDTPGIHNAWTELNKRMVAASRSAIGDVDVVLFLIDVTAAARRVEAGEPALDAEDIGLAELLAGSGKPIVIVANKVDVTPKPLVLPVIQALSEVLPDRPILPLSALTGDGVDGLLAELYRILPEHPALFPPDEWTQASERFLVAETVREKIFELTDEEVPYATTVEVIKFDEAERAGERGIVRILADIIVERPSQKGILIGKGGERMKKIGSLARTDIQELLGCRVYLELFVRVERDWSKTLTGLSRVGFNSNGSS